ncbi:hypothetical protein [Rathayibacter festucae]|uniref:hypothetical protein n=1 Tax=Rathayibacter festucae TaxID=110937 RepID=UPI000FDC0FC3|nr:hypothetical protein [Rathayibacter festucae]
MVQIPDQASKSNAAASDLVLIRDVSSNTDKKTTVLGLSAGLNSRTVDANGWTVFDNGTWKEYEKKFTGGSVGGSGSGSIANVIPGLNFPTGVSPASGKWSITIAPSAFATQAFINPELDLDSTSLTYTWACHAYRVAGANPVPFSVTVRGRV